MPDKMKMHKGMKKRLTQCARRFCNAEDGT